MEKRDPFAVRTEQHVVEPAGRVFHVGPEILFRDLRHADRKFRDIVLEVDQPDAFILGSEDLFIFVERAGIAVAGPFAVETREIEAERPASVRTQAINRTADGLFFAGPDIEDPGDEMVAFAVVVDDLGLCVVEPLEHAALLPAPGIGFGDGDEFIVVLQVDHAEHGFFTGDRLTGGEIGFLRQQIASGLIPRELVEIAEEMVFGSFRDAPYGQMFFFDHDVMLLVLVRII